MTPGALARQLFTHHPDFRFDSLGPRQCKHAAVREALEGLTARSDGLLTLHDVGRSLEGRPISMVSCGKGDKRVLLWSQMHGDEPTATLALLDIFNFLTHTTGREAWVGEMLDGITMYVVPMLNPDGAERNLRRTASGIDMNRDARALVTVEANLLRGLQRRLRPRFGFNLHDQELSSVGETTKVTAMALLAPALDVRRSTPLVRVRAMRVAALIARVLTPVAEGHLARYNDAFEPRAFGDNMQAWGTSTVLIESGHWPRDREKKTVRRLNFVAILSALHSIGDGSYQDVDMDHYRDLPENGKRLFDILIRDVVIKHRSGARHAADVGLMAEPAHNRQGTRLVVTVKDIGDLSTFGGLEVVAGGRRPVAAERLVPERVVPLSRLLDELQLYHPV
jgi:hypothetical protein